jgi:hypothetical protein
MPPVFEIHACSHDLTIYELDWTASDVAKSYAFTYGWVRASQARGLVEEIERLRARVEVLRDVSDQLSVAALDFAERCARVEAINARMRAEMEAACDFRQEEAKL